MKIEWYMFALHCRDASDHGMATKTIETLAPETAKLIEKHTLKTALNYLNQAAALIGYSLVKNTELPNEVSK